MLSRAVYVEGYERSLQHLLLRYAWRPRWFRRIWIWEPRAMGSVFVTVCNHLEFYFFNFYSLTLSLVAPFTDFSKFVIVVKTCDVTRSCRGQRDLGEVLYHSRNSVVRRASNASKLSESLQIWLWVGGLRQRAFGHHSSRQDTEAWLMRTWRESSGSRLAVVGEEKARKWGQSEKLVRFFK